LPKNSELRWLHGTLDSLLLPAVRQKSSSFSWSLHSLTPLNQEGRLRHRPGEAAWGEVRVVDDS